ERAKSKRVKKLELPISDGRLWFALSTWTDAALEQVVRYDGIHKSNSSRKDDFPDALSILWQEFGPKYAEAIKPKDEEERRRMEEEEGERLRQQHFREAMCGAPNNYNVHKTSDFLPGRKPPEPATPTEPEQPVDPRLRIFGGKGPWRL